MQGQCKAQKLIGGVYKDTAVVQEVAWVWIDEKGWKVDELLPCLYKLYTAFSLPLLKFQNFLWNHFHVAASAFTIQSGKHMSDSHYGHMACEPCKPFSNAVDLYRELEDMTTHLIYSVLKLSPQEIPETQTTKNQLIVCLDANFQQHHHTKARRNYDQIRFPNMFLNPHKIDDMTTLIREREQQNKTNQQVKSVVGSKHIFYFSSFHLFIILSLSLGEHVFANYISCTLAKKRYQNALKHCESIKGNLLSILAKPNPFMVGKNYTCGYLRLQWDGQQKFQDELTSHKDKHRRALVTFYKREASIKALRLCCFLKNKLCDQITVEAESLEKDWEVYTGGGHPASEIGEEKKLIFLLWSSKSNLFVEVVELRATIQPIEEAKTAGQRILLTKFNKKFEDFISKYPEQWVADQSHHPLTYKAFAKMPLDNCFWNYGLHYHLEAPLAVDTDVQLGIYCICLLDRVREELELIAEDMAQKMGEEKLQLINRELQVQLYNHGILIQRWSNHIAWLWDYYEGFDSGNSI
ncbi:uncharacterized protein VP01_1834g3 [Puccinia sorghi]|uniref:CxC1-like cysteine cluster associated with KDZ transposases domain-containing protein n=1 Tax=Puccinia sorghi TaxID=27349 RepID=A0A0L6VDX7_9BASI|nr:uncharacterized protein VP01_1834g3 [Puccinia sorghi]